MSAGISMQKKNLGKTGMQVAPLGLGTVKLGRSEGVKYPEPVQIPNDADARKLLDTAHSLGVNLLDTAPAYGHSEERLGQLLENRRDHWLLCTKVGETFANGQSSYDFSATAVTESVERSLRRLRTDVLDIVLIHSDGNDTTILQGDALDTLQRLKADGKIRAVGLSHKTIEGARLALALGVDVLMATLNRGYVDEAGVIAEAADAGVGVLIKKALASGHNDPSDLSFVSGFKGVSSIVIGTTNVDHLQQNVTALGWR